MLRKVSKKMSGNSWILSDFRRQYLGNRHHELAANAACDSLWRQLKISGAKGRDGVA
jgi:hypothetical protein